MNDALELHRRAHVVDTHNDLLMLVSRRPRREQAAYFRHAWLPQLRAGGVDVQVLPVFIDDPYRPEGALRQTLRMLEAGWELASGNADQVRVCLSGADIDATMQSGRIALVLALEGCDAVGKDLELFRALARAGVRLASLTHFGRNALADGSAEDGAGSRLTRAGVEAVDVLEEVGILLDVSHLSAAGVDHVLEIATRPVLASHSSVKALRGHHRNLTDARIQGIAATGGVINVNLFAGFLADTAADHTVARACDHIEHVATLTGPGSVGLGSDFIRQVLDELRPHEPELLVEGVDARSSIPGLEGPAGLPLLTAELLGRGWLEADVLAVLGGNDLRVFREQLHDPPPHSGTR